MSLYITKFVDRLSSAESRNAKEFTCPIADAKGLHKDLTRVLAEIESLRSKQVRTSDDTIELVVQGGNWSDKHK